MRKIIRKITIQQTSFFGAGSKQVILSNPIVGDIKLTSFLNNYIEEVDILMNEVNKNTAKSLLEISDSERDYDLIGLIEMVEVLKYSNIEAEVEAYEKLKKIIEHFGGRDIPRLNFARQTAISHALFTELMKPENLVFLELNERVLTMFNKAKASQEAFVTELASYEEAKAEDDTAPKAYIQKKKVINIYNSIVQPYLNVMMLTEPDTYRALHDSLTELVTDVNEQIKRHYTMLRKKAEEANQEGENPETPENERNGK